MNEGEGVAEDVLPGLLPRLWHRHADLRNDTVDTAEGKKSALMNAGSHAPWALKATLKNEVADTKEITYYLLLTLSS